MSNLMKSLFTMIIQSAGAITMGMTMVNSLARAGVERAVVVEKKSIAAAAMSELRNANDVAKQLDEITSEANGISAESFNKAKAFLEAYQAKRSAELDGTTVPITTIPDPTPPTSRKKS